MKKSVFLLAVMLLFVFSASSFALSVGYVDIEKVFSQYKGTTEAKEKLQKEVEKEQKAVEKEKDAILKEKADLDKKKAILDRAKVEELEMALQEKAQKLQEKALKIQQDLLAREKALTSNIIDEIRAIVQKIAKEKNFDMVFEKNTLLYGGEDITYLVTKEINK